MCSCGIGNIIGVIKLVFKANGPDEEANRLAGIATCEESIHKPTTK